MGDENEKDREIKLTANGDAKMTILVEPIETTTTGQAIDVPAGPVAFPLVPERTALLIIDMQKELLAPGGYFGEDQAGAGYSTETLRQPIEPIRRLMDVVRGTDILVIFTRHGKRPDMADEPPCDIGRFKAARDAGVPGAAVFGEPARFGRMCIRGELGWEVVDELLPQEGEPIVEKATKGSFRHTDLELILRNQRRDSLLITGITTDVCVTTTMRDGNDLGFACCLLTDCCASLDEKIHQSMIDQLPIQAGIFGWWSTSDKLTQALEAAQVVKPPEARPKRALKDPSAYW